MKITISKDFKKVSKESIFFLKDKLGFDLWFVAFYLGKDFYMLESLGTYSNIEKAESLKIATCLHKGAQTDKNIQIIPNLKNHQNSMGLFEKLDFELGAYISAPLFDQDGKVMGCLCGMSATPQPQSLADNANLVKVFSYLLETVLNQSLKADAVMKDNQKLLVEANTDALTNLCNRRAWDEAVVREEERCSRYSASAGILIIDLDGLKSINDEKGHCAGDKLICSAAIAIESAVRDGDVVARVGGDEFTVLAVECDLAKTKTTAKRIKQSLMRAGVEASIGWAVREPELGLIYAQQAADRMLYRNKRARSSI